MTNSEISPIVGNQTGITASQAADIAARVNNWAGGNASSTLRDYVRTVIEQGLELGIDPILLLGQSHLETDGWTSQWWKERINPAGIGITGDKADDVKSQTWLSGHDAAMGHLAHMAAYVWGSDWRKHWDVDALGLPSHWDQRFDLALKSGNRASTLNHLGKSQKKANGQWTGWSDNDPTYGAKIASRANQIVKAIADEANTPASVPEGETTEMPTPVFGRVPEPPYIRMIVPKTAPGYGFDICPPRKNIGIVIHETQGDPPGTGLLELQWYYRFFACPNGERCGNGGSIDGALVDWVCARDGTAAMFNDPRGTREPYSNGGKPNTSDPEGKAWNARFGSDKRNTILESCEMVKAENDRLTTEQIEWGASRMAFVADQDQQLWSEYPYPKKYGGTNQNCNHGQLSQTTCHQHPDDNAALRKRSKEILKQYQIANVTTPAPTPVPDIFPGVDLAIAKRLFGMVNGEDNKTYQFDPDGPVSKLWLSRAKQTGAWPPLATVWTYEDGRRYFRFADGSLILARPNTDPVWVKAA